MPHTADVPQCASLAKTGETLTVNKSNAPLELSEMTGNQMKNLLKYWQGDGRTIDMQTMLLLGRPSFNVPTYKRYSMQQPGKCNIFQRFAR
jgi:hypothetical protein